MIAVFFQKHVPNWFDQRRLSLIIFIIQAITSVFSDLSKEKAQLKKKQTRFIWNSWIAKIELIWLKIHNVLFVLRQNKK